MAQQSEKFETIVKHIQKLNGAENVVKQKLAPINKLTTPATRVQPKMNPEVEGTAAGIEGHGVKDKSEDYLKKSEEWLKSVDKTLKSIQVSFAKNSSSSNRSDNLSGKSGGAGKLPDLPKDYTLTEGLKSTVGMAKSIGKGIAGFASNPTKSLSNTFGSVKDSVKGALGTAKNILNAEAGYTPERERFAKGYAASAKGTQFQKGGKSALDAGKDKYDALKTKEEQINTIKEKMDVPASQGFSPLKKDQKELDKLSKEFDALDPRVVAPSIKEDKSPNEKITAASVNPESDNIQTSGELVSEEIRQTNDLIGQNLSIVKEQLEELKGIRLALAPNPVDEPNKDPNKRTIEKLDELIEAVKEIEVGGGGSGGLSDLIPGGGKAAAAGKIASAMSKFGKVAKIGGAALAIGAGAYTAYKGFTAAEDSKQAKLDEVQAKVDSGQMKPEEAAAARKEIGNTSTVEKSAAIGEGTGLAGGAIAGGLAGAKLGGTIGTVFGGPIGTAVGAGIGGLAGGAIGAFAGSGAGKAVGEYGGKAINAVGDFFGGVGDKVKGVYNSSTDAGKGVTQADQKVSSNRSIDQSEIASQGVTTSKSKVQEGVTAEKAVLGSTFLGGLFTAKGKESGSFAGTSSEETAVRGKVENKDISKTETNHSNMIGKRISGGLLGKDTYKISSEGKDNSEYDTEVTKHEYKQLQELNAKGDVEGARKKLTAIKAAKAAALEPSSVDAMGNITGAQPSVMTGLEVKKASTENADLNREASRGTTNVTPIVSNSSSTNNNTSYVPVKPSPRNERGGSAIDRYQDRVSAF